MYGHTFRNDVPGIYGTTICTCCGYKPASAQQAIQAERPSDPLIDALEESIEAHKNYKQVMASAE